MASLGAGALQKLLAGFERLIESSEFSDLTIYSTDREYAVHSTVVCPQSAFFWAACTRNLKVGDEIYTIPGSCDRQERNSRKIDLRNDNPGAVHCMIRYFYTFMYPEDVKADEAVSPIAKDSKSSEDDQNSETGNNPFTSGQEEGLENDGCQQMVDAKENKDLASDILQQDLLVYALAEKYGIADLQEKAALNFDQKLQKIETTLDILDIARDVYSATASHDRGLRNIIIARVYGEIQHWMKEAEFIKILASEGEFCADLLKYTVEEDRKRYERASAKIEEVGYCPECYEILEFKKLYGYGGNITEKYCASCTI